MGIHYWSKSAVLTLLVVLSIGHAHAATRKSVSMPSDGQVIGSGNGSSRSGDTLHVPGDGKTEYIPSSYGGGSKGTKLPIKPTYDYSIPRTVKGMTTNLRGGVYGAVLGIGLQYMLDSVDGFIKDNQVHVPSTQTVPGGYYWGITSSDLSFRGLTPYESCQKLTNGRISSGAIYTYKSHKILTTNQATCTATVKSTSGAAMPDTTWTLYRYGSSCPSGSTYNPVSGGCEAEGSRIATDADYDLMEAAAAAKDSEWLKERLREHCEGGLNPQACYESLRDNTWLEGPSSVTEPGPTTTTTSPAGTTSTTSNTRYDITYGNNYYDYRSTKTTIVTKPDGTTETTTETEPETDQPREDEDQDINFTDSEFPPVEPFYQQKYPDGLDGVWQNAQAKFDNSQFMSFLQSFIPQFSGSCPSWSMSFNIASWASYGNVPFVNLCYVFDFIKVIMLVTALFTARAITFGG
ncbi:hypothetical protein [Stutzerimonas kunmingensis]|uniref:hypothetical protein n=1 Tax=Stutzerimonas kunmingensis TaxID=1211807 RepID=UPI001F2C8367|nr:hypothetical protein [Stutzerimonas kunmingensis]UIP30890.1 hypothetical protein LW136_11975 [Stutzerimonas kunmingensis]